VLLWLLWRDASAGWNVTSRLHTGLGLGLVAAATGVFWERFLFVGLGDFDAWFRAAGLVSATHVGGAYLEAMLVVLAPFSLAHALRARRPAIAVLWSGVTAIGALALLLTLSRAAAAAWLLGIGAFALLWWVGHRQPVATAATGWRRAVGAAAALAALVGAGALMVQSTALRERMAGSGSDLGVRIDHWRDTLGLMGGDPTQVALGMGLGSFPREFYLARSLPKKLPAYRLERAPDSGKSFLVLAGGGGMYLDQRVAAAPGRELRLRGLIRSAPDRAELAVALCEKSFLASVRCDWAQVPAGSSWATFDVVLKLPETPARRLDLRVPVSLSLNNSRYGTRIEITDLSLADGPAELLANGSFERGLDHWLMHSDVHLAWRALNTPVQIVFEQGGFGLLAWAVLVLAVAVRLGRGSHQLPAAAAAAAVAFVAVGCFDTLLDAPRLVVLAALVLWLLTNSGSQPFTGQRWTPR
jgi:hypothetical protein